MIIIDKFTDSYLNEKASNVDEWIIGKMDQILSLKQGQSVNVYSGGKNYVIVDEGSGKYTIKSGKGFDKYLDNKLNKLYRDSLNSKYLQLSDVRKFITTALNQLWNKKRGT